MTQTFSEQDIWSILDVSPAIIYACRAYGDFGATFVSGNITARFGYSVAECLENPSFWKENIHPEDRGRVFAEYDCLFDTGHHIHEYRFRKKDGRFIWVLDEVRLLRDASGRPERIIGSWLEITDRKQAEQALLESERLFRDFFEANPVSTIMTSPSGTVHMVNPAFLANSGFDRDEVVGRNVRELGFWDNPEDRERMVAALRENGVFENAESLFVRKDGRPVHCLYSSRAIALDGEQRILSILMDITELKKAEETLRRLDTTKSEFISTAAHELRTPLATIMGYTELFADPEVGSRIDEEQKRQVLSEIYEGCERLNKIVDSLLDITRIEAGQPLPLEKASHPIAGLVEKVVERLRPKARQQLLLDVRPGVPASLQCDAHRIDQVVDNLLSNAIKYSPKQTTIRVVIDADDAECSVTVVDQGAGMTAEQVARIFDKFYRADATDTAIPGIGLGMSIVRKIVEDHGGAVRVDSVVGEGTRVRFSLPLRSA